MMLLKFHLIKTYITNMSIYLKILIFVMSKNHPL